MARQKTAPVAEDPALKRVSDEVFAALMRQPASKRADFLYVAFHNQRAMEHTRIGQEIEAMFYEAMFCYGDYNIDRWSDSPAINAGLNIARWFRWAREGREKSGRPPNIDNDDRSSEAVRLRDEEHVLFKELGRRLREINPEWCNKDGTPYKERTAKMIYRRAKGLAD